MRMPMPKSASSARAAEVESGLWVIGGRIALYFVIIVGFGTLDDGLLGFNLKPTLNLLATLMMIATVIIMSPRGRALRITFPLGFTLFVTWMLCSVLWTAFPPGFSIMIMPEMTTLIGLIFLGGLLPRAVVLRAIVNSYYVIVGITLLATVVQPQKALNSLSLEGQTAVTGWHGAFLHKNFMTAYLIFGTILVLVAEHRRWLRVSTVVMTLALTVLGNSGTGLAAFFVVMTMYWWLDRFLKKNKRMGVAFLFISVMITGVGAWLTTALAPLILSLYGKDLSFSGRTKIWTGVVDAIGKRPWQGWGYGGAWIDATREPTLSINKPLGFYVVHAHNGYLEILLRVGVIGLGFWLLAFASTLIAGVRVLRIDPQVGKAAVLVCILILVFSVSEPMVFGPWFGLLAVFRVLAVRSFTPHSRKVDPTPLLRRTAPATGAVYTTPSR